MRRNFLLFSAVCLWSQGLVDSLKLLPFGAAAGDTPLIPGDDNGAIVNLPTALPFFSFTAKQHVYISTNGALALSLPPFTNSTPVPLASVTRPLIAPFWADAFTRYDLPGKIYYRVPKPASPTQQQAAQLVTKNFPSLGAGFAPNLSIVVTWSQVTCFGCTLSPPLNTFQLLLTSDGARTFVFYLYQGLQWSKGVASASMAVAGHTDGAGSVWQAAGSGTDAVRASLLTGSNCASGKGVWAFAAFTPPSTPAPSPTMVQSTDRVEKGRKLEDDGPFEAPTTQPPPPPTTPPTTSSTTTQTTTTTQAPYGGSALECSAILAKYPASADGVYPILVNGVTRQAYCDMTNRGWTYIQRRTGDGSVNFAQTNSMYVGGFGNPASDYWLGLDAIRYIAAQGPHALMVELSDCNNFKGTATYSNFTLGSGGCYPLQFTPGSVVTTGGVGDGLNYQGAPDLSDLGKGFSTIDKDCGGYYVNCGSYMKSGWWFGVCPAISSNLNGRYFPSCDITEQNVGIMWNAWKNAHYSLATAAMKIKPM